MSRTDKDRPYEVRLRDPHEATVEHHDHTPPYRFCITQQVERESTYSVFRRDDAGLIHRTRRWTENLGFRVAGEPECDLDYSDRPSNRLAQRRWRHCYRSFLYQERWRVSSVPKWYTDHRWNNPERVRVRDDLRDAARRWNAGDDLDGYDFPNYAHRHCAAWDWD